MPKQHLDSLLDERLRAGIFLRRDDPEAARHVRIDPAGAVPPAAGSGGAVVVSWPLDVPRRAWRRLRGGARLAFARLVDLVGALARPAAAGAGAVPGRVQLVGNLRPMRGRRGGAR